MKTLTVQEASRNLSELVQRAVEGEEVAINDGACTVLLQPVFKTTGNQPGAREALRLLQSQSRLTAGVAESYLREVHAERLAHENGSGQ